MRKYLQVRKPLLNHFFSHAVINRHRSDGPFDLDVIAVLVESSDLNHPTEHRKMIRMIYVSQGVLEALDSEHDKDKTSWRTLAELLAQERHAQHYQTQMFENI